MRPISKRRKNRILRRLFSGESYGYVAEKEGVSKSTVKVVFDEFMGRAADSLLMEAADDYDASEEIETLRELSVESKMADVSIPELLAAARLSALMKKLDLSATGFQDYLEMYAKHKQKFGDFSQAAMKLSKLEKETGKTYHALITHFEKTARQARELRKDEEELNLRVRNLREECETTTKNLESLNEKSRKAQRILATLSNARLELAGYGLRSSDFEKVKTFLSEIQRLGGKPAKAVEILKKISSLEAKLQEKSDQYTQSERFMKDLEKRIDKKKETLRQLKNEETEENVKIRNLKGRRVALEKQTDGLLKKQAALLKVQPDIDLVSEALPARKIELERLKQQIKEEETLIAAAEAIAVLFARKSYDRKAIIQWLQLTKNTETYEPVDELVRQTIVRLMGEQGFVPTEKLQALEKKVEKELTNCIGQTERWKRIAENRLEELEECQEQLKREYAVKDRKLDESIHSRIANIVTEVAKKAST